MSASLTAQTYRGIHESAMSHCPASLAAPAVNRQEWSWPPRWYGRWWASYSSYSLDSSDWREQLRRSNIGQLLPPASLRRAIHSFHQHHILFHKSFPYPPSTLLSTQRPTRLLSLPSPSPRSRSKDRQRIAAACRRAPDSSPHWHVHTASEPLRQPANGQII